MEQVRNINRYSIFGTPSLFKIILTTINATLILTSSPAHSADPEFFGGPLSHDHKCKIEIIKTDQYWYTNSFRPDPPQDMVSEPFHTERHVLHSGKACLYGGTVIGEDTRQQISDTRHHCWQVHGQLTLMFGDNAYTGSATLISPWHALTAGHLLYDPEQGIWAENIIFHPGRNGDDLLHRAVSCPKKAVLAPWKYGAEAFDMGIVELAEDVGSKLGWNSLLAGEDSFISRLDPVIVAGYPGDKPSGTMWGDYTKQEFIKVFTDEITYRLSAGEGQDGASLWATNNEAGGFYSIGVHTSGIQDQEKGIFNIATRLTYEKMNALENLINNLL